MSVIYQLYPLHIKCAIHYVDRTNYIYYVNHTNDMLIMLIIFIILMLIILCYVILCYAIL